LGQRAVIHIPGEALKKFCEAHHIVRLAFYGSVLRNDFGPDSDIDILVEFEPDARVGLLKMARLENELSHILGRKVDLRTRFDLSRYFRQEVFDNAEVAYAKG
jgi:uncharacterized protein